MKLANNTPPRPEYWVLSLSGGKDSTALGLEWLTRHLADPVTYPLDEVIYLADLTSEERDYADVGRMRKLAEEAGLGVAMREAMIFALEDLVTRGLGISQNSFDAYNHYVTTVGEDS